MDETRQREGRRVDRTRGWGRRPRVRSGSGGSSRRPARPPRTERELVEGEWVEVERKGRLPPDRHRRKIGRLTALSTGVLPPGFRQPPAEGIGPGRPLIPRRPLPPVSHTLIPSPPYHKSGSQRARVKKHGSKRVDAEVVESP